MNSSIYIDGIALWVFLFLIVLLTACVIVLGLSLIRTINERAETQAENERLRRKLCRTMERLYKITYKVPEVD